MNVEDLLSDIEKDTLGEIGNISFGSSATALSSLLNKKLRLHTCLTYQKGKFGRRIPKPYVAVTVDYTVGFTGRNLLVINLDDASIIADLMLEEQENPNWKSVNWN